MPSLLYLHSPSSQEHDTGAHPERAERITAIERELEAHDWFGYRRERAAAASREQLEYVHSGQYIDSIRVVCESGGGSLDPDTVVSGGSWQAALDAAGGAVQMADALMSGEADVAFCGLRPPGHHAEAARAMGFCLFNNIAVAARHALTAHRARRVMIFDWDVHHGNGTNDIFKATSEVLYCSIHQMPLYPGTGVMDEYGSGEGEGYTVNLPVPPGSGEIEYLSLIDHVVLRVARAFRPSLLLVSAGYDAHRDDPLAGIELGETAFAGMTSMLRGLTRELEIPLGFVLEGGYDLEALSRSVAATLEATSVERSMGEVELLPIADRASSYFERWWQRDIRE